jgi:hypothetical protein
MHASHLHAFLPLACILTPWISSTFMQSYNTYDLSPLLSSLSLAFLPEDSFKANRTCLHHQCSEILHKSTCFYSWERQKKGALSDEGAKKKALGLWEGDHAPFFSLPFPAFPAFILIITPALIPFNYKCFTGQCKMKR